MFVTVIMLKNVHISKHQKTIWLKETKRLWRSHRWDYSIGIKLALTILEGKIWLEERDIRLQVSLFVDFYDRVRCGSIIKPRPTQDKPD